MKSYKICGYLFLSFCLGTVCANSLQALIDRAHDGASRLRASEFADQPQSDTGEGDFT